MSCNTSAVTRVRPDAEMRNRTFLLVLCSIPAVVGILIVSLTLFRPWILQEWWIHRLSSKDQAVRTEAAERLAAIRSPRSIVALANALHAEMTTGWTLAARALAKIGPKAVLVTLMSTNQRDPDQVVDVMNAILLMMGMDPDVRSRESIQEVAECFALGPEGVKIVCADYGFMDIGFKEASVVLPAILKKIEKGNATQVAGSIEEALLKDSLDLLSDFLASKDVQIQKMVKEAIAANAFILPAIQRLSDEETDEAHAIRTMATLLLEKIKQLNQSAAPTPSGTRQ